MGVLILGLGQYPKGSGVAAALFFAKRGDDVTVYDYFYTPAMDVNVRRLKKFRNVRFVLKRRRLAEIKRADLIVKHQRIRMDDPEVREALRLGKSVESEISLFLKECPGRVIGITGTRGKSTTTMLIAEMLKADGRRTWLGGNILVSPLTFLHKIRPHDWVVLELSSFQLEGTGLAGISPSVAVWTNLMRDHLNAYPSMKAYAEAKAQIFRHQKPEGIALLPADRSFNAYAASAPGRVYRWGKHGSPETKLVASVPLKITGEHNRRNASCAAAVALALGVKPPVIKRVLRAFKGLPNRLETIATIRGIRFVNDTTATTPDATIAAIQALHASRFALHLIFGGADKELVFEDAARALKKYRVDVALLPGTARGKIVKAFRRARVAFTDVPNLHAALAGFLKEARKGDVVLLSPGCASFGLFKNEFDRGEQFKRIVKRLR